MILRGLCWDDIVGYFTMSWILTGLVFTFFFFLMTVVCFCFFGFFFFDILKNLEHLGYNLFQMTGP